MNNKYRFKTEDKSVKILNFLFKKIRVGDMMIINELCFFMLLIYCAKIIFLN